MAKKVVAQKKQNDFFRSSLFFLGTSCILLIAVIFISGRYFEAKSAFEELIANNNATTNMYRAGNAQEDAKMIATTIGSFPSGYPLFVQQKQLQDYVAAVSRQTGRDLVVTNIQKIIQADTVPGNIGKEYTEDPGGEVAATLKDGQTRTFVEKSADYPQGISETVVPLLDTNNNIVGAVIFSASTIFNK